MGSLSNISLDTCLNIRKPSKMGTRLMGGVRFARDLTMHLLRLT